MIIDLKVTIKNNKKNYEFSDSELIKIYDKEINKDILFNIINNNANDIIYKLINYTILPLKVYSSINSINRAIKNNTLLEYCELKCIDNISNISKDNFWNYSNPKDTPIPSMTIYTYYFNNGLLTRHESYGEFDNSVFNLTIRKELNDYKKSQQFLHFGDIVNFKNFNGCVNEGIVLLNAKDELNNSSFSNVYDIFCTNSKEIIEGVHINDIIYSTFTDTELAKKIIKKFSYKYTKEYLDYLGIDKE